MSTAVFWFRRDMRLEDNTALAEAQRQFANVLPVFIFDSDILNHLPRVDKRVQFIHATVQKLKKQIEESGGELLVLHGKPLKLWPEILSGANAEALFFNDDYEPYARARDQAVVSLAKERNVRVLVYKDHVIFAKNEIQKDDGQPYRVYTPYSKKWLATLDEKKDLRAAKNLKSFGKWSQTKMNRRTEIPTLTEMGFSEVPTTFPLESLAPELLKSYAQSRDLLALDKGTSRLGLHLRFGTVSTRDLAKKSLNKSPVFLRELIWREFFQQILFHYPETVSAPFDQRYQNLEWLNDPDEFKRWQDGETGYPLVDAGMRELNSTGFMHNRARMTVASFLTKHLLIDWRWGERYFAEKLLDFELASNVGNWQWAAGCGCDAAPYFRVFNPSLQAKKFDPDEIYVQKWVPERKLPSYPKPMVEHDFARRRALAVFDKALKGPKK